MNWQLVSDPEDMLNRGSLKTKVKMESDGKTITTQYEQDEDYIREMLEVNVALQNADRRSTSLWDNRNLVHVARIPEELILRWQIEEGINFYRCSEEDRARLFAKLNDGDYNRLRTAPGRI